MQFVYKELSEIPNDSPLFKPCVGEFDGVKVHRTMKVVYGKKRTILVTWNPGLYTAQALTVEQDIKKAIEELSEIKSRWQARSESKLPIKGKKPTEQSVRNQCEAIMSRPYMQKLIPVRVLKDSKGNLLIDYTIDVNALTLITNTYLGKNILITNRDEWDNEKIIRAY